MQVSPAVTEGQKQDLLAFLCWIAVALLVVGILMMALSK
jgi:hypothetical protein